MKATTKKNIALFLIIFIIGLTLIYFGRREEKIPAQNFNSLIGQTAPAFTLTDRDNNTYSLAELKGKNVLLFFNEGLICYPACWDEIVALAKDKRFAENNTVVLSVVTDPKEQWQKAIEKMPALAKAKILFDTNTSVSKAYEMLNVASSMHRGTTPGHTYVLIDKDGIIKYVFDDIRMGKNEDKLLGEIKKINNY